MDLSRLYSAAAFAAAPTILVALVTVGLWLINPGSSGAFSLFLIGVVPSAIPAATIGALVGPRLVRCESATEAAVVGAVVALASAFMFWLGVAVIMALGAASRGSDLLQILDSWLTLETLGTWMLYSLVVGAAVSPVGAGAGVLAWRWTRRGAPEPVA